MKTILLDTSFLVDCVKSKVDIWRELDRILPHNFIVGILDRTMDELDTIITTKKGKEKEAAKLAKTILLTKHVTIYPTEGGHTDTLLLRKADENHVVATSDGELKKKLKAKKQNVVVLRAQKKLALIEA